MPATALQQHYLRPLLLPNAIAVVGASERPGSLGRVVLENALGGAFADRVHAVNPHHREVLGRPCHPSVAAVGSAIELALIATPPEEALAALDDCANAHVPAAIVLTEPPQGLEAGRTWLDDARRRAAHRGIRVIGPGAFGLLRSDRGLNASTHATPVQDGRIALVSQSAAVCTAMLDFAHPLRIGFSTVVSLGAAVDIDFGELLDLLLLDERTDSILLYVETIRQARRFISALRAAARTKPVIVLKSGRSIETHAPSQPSPDAVFDSAIHRAGSVRVHSYTQLFAAARILSLGRIPHEDRLAIIANGRAPGLLAADSTLDRGVRFATLSPATREALRTLVSSASECSNPIDIRASATPDQLAAALGAVVDDEGVDGVLVLNVPRPRVPSLEMAAAVAGVALRTRKPVLASWLGALERPEVTEAFERGGVADFYTPENAVHAFSFLAAYRRNQQWLLEVPPPMAEPRAPDLVAAEAVRRELDRRRESTMTREQATRLLAAFGIDAAPATHVQSEAEAKHEARRIGYPVTLEIVTPRSSLVVRNVRDARSVARAFRTLEAALAVQDPAVRPDVRVRRSTDALDASELAIAAFTNPTFGPVVSLGHALAKETTGFAPRALMLPPLNRRLAGDLIDTFVREHAHSHFDANAREPVIGLLLAVSAIVCLLPWVTAIDIDPVLSSSDGIAIGDVRIRADPRRARVQRYAHMAIHPYPAELVEEVRARDGTKVTVRPIRPEDAELERTFVASLSDESRFFRFFYQMHELSPTMLARFTQIDYDRELALVAVVDAPRAGGEAFAGVARYIENPDRQSAEYAIVVHDAWQRHGIGRLLMERLIAAARRKGLVRLDGAVLRENARMLAFAKAHGFSVAPDPDDSDQMLTRLELQ